MSGMSSAFSKAGWEKYQFPPDMITAEEKEKKMKLSWIQMKRTVQKQIENRTLMAEQRGDEVTANEWKKFMIKMEAKQITQRVNEEFIQDFIKWLTGRSVYNAKEYVEFIKDETGSVIGRDLTPGCPWGNKPLFALPGVTEFVDQGLDRRSRVITYISKLKMNGPRNLNEAYMFYKYVLRRVAVDEDSCFEVEEMADFDYPVDPETGGTVGPATLESTPPLFDEKKYRKNFTIMFFMAHLDPASFATWLVSGAPPVDVSDKFSEEDIAAFYRSHPYISDERDEEGRPYEAYADEEEWISYPVNHQDEFEDWMEEYARRGDLVNQKRQERREARRRGKRRDRFTSAGSRATKSAGFSWRDFTVGPEGRATMRRIDRREERRDGRQIDRRETMAESMALPEFGTFGYVSFWSLSGSDQDYITSILLAQNAFMIAKEVNQSAVLTGGTGHPVVDPPPKRNEPKYPYPASQTEQNRSDNKNILDKLVKMEKQIRSIPNATNDPKTAELLQQISETTSVISRKLDNPPKAQYTDARTINVDNSSVANQVGLVTKAIGALSGAIKGLETKIENFNPQAPVIPQPQWALPEEVTKIITDQNVKFDKVLGVLNGLPAIFADLPGKSVAGPPSKPNTGNANIDARTATINTKSTTINTTNRYGIGQITIDQKQFAQDVAGAMGAPIFPDANLYGVVEGPVNAVMSHSGPLTATLEHKGDLKAVLHNTGELKVTAGDVNADSVTAVGDINAGEVKSTGPVTATGGTFTGGVTVNNPQFEAPVIKNPRIDAKIENPQINLKAVEATAVFDETKLGKAIGSAIQVDISEIAESIKGLKSTFDTQESRRNASEQAYQRKIDTLMTQLQEQGVAQGKLTTQMKTILESMNSTQTQVTEILAQHEDILKLLKNPKVEPKSTGEKIAQEVKLSDETIDRVLSGNADMSKLLEEIRDSMVSNKNPQGVLALLQSMATHNLNVANHVQKLKDEFIGDNVGKYLPKNYFKTVVDHYESVANQAAMNPIEDAPTITEENYAKMEKQLADTQKELNNAKMAFAKSETNMLKKLKEMEQAGETIKQQAQTMNEQTKKEAASTYAQLYNAHNLLLADVQKKAQEIATLSQSNLAIKSQLEVFKNTPLNVKLEALQFQEIKQALVLSQEPDDEDLEDQGEEQPPRQEPTTPEIITEAQQIKEYIQKNPLPVYMSRELAESREALNNVLDMVIASGSGNLFNYVANPMIAGAETINKISSLYQNNKIRLDLNEQEQAFLQDPANLDLINQYSVFAPAGEAIQKAEPHSKYLALTDLSKLDSRDTQIEVLFRGLQTAAGNQGLAEKKLAGYQPLLNILSKSAAERIVDPKTAQNHFSQSPSQYANKKFSVADLRQNLGYYGNSGTEVHPEQMEDIKGYSTLVMAAKAFVDSMHSPDNSKAAFADTVRNATVKYSPVTSNSFTRNSPLFTALALGDVGQVQDILAGNSAGHGMVDYGALDTTAKTIVGLQMRHFRDFTANFTQNATISEEYKSHIIQQLAQSRHVDTPVTAAGLSQGVDPELTSEVQSIQHEESSAYLEAFLQATLAHRASQFLAKKTKGGKDEGESWNDIKDLGAQYNKKCLDNLAGVERANPQIELMIKSRQDRIDTIAAKLVEMLANEQTDAYQQLTTKNRSVDDPLVKTGLESFSKGVDIVSGLASPDILKGGMEDTFTQNLIARQLEKAVSFFDSQPATYVKSQNTMDAELQKQLQTAIDYVTASRQNKRKTDTFIGHQLMTLSQIAPVA